MKISAILVLFFMSSTAAFANFCEIQYPNRTDKNNRYCDNSYGVLFNGFSINSKCYDSADKALEILRGAAVCEYGDSRGSCSIQYPDRTDSNRRYCNRTFGVLFNGFSMNSKCYSTADEALSVMLSANVCIASPVQKACSIQYPDRTDNNRRYCDRAYGVLFNGFSLNGKCYSTADEALKVMQDDVACQ